MTWGVSRTVICCNLFQQNKSRLFFFVYLPFPSYTLPPSAPAGRISARRRPSARSRPSWPSGRWCRQTSRTPSGEIKMLAYVCYFFHIELMWEQMFKSTNAHVDHVISATAAITWLQTCCILATLVLVVGRWGVPNAAFLALTLFQASLGNQGSWATSNPFVERTPLYSYFSGSSFLIHLYIYVDKQSTSKNKKGKVRNIPARHMWWARMFPICTSWRRRGRRRPRGCTSGAGRPEVPVNYFFLAFHSQNIHVQQYEQQYFSIHHLGFLWQSQYGACLRTSLVQQGLFLCAIMVFVILRRVRLVVHVSASSFCSEKIQPLGQGSTASIWFQRSLHSWCQCFCTNRKLGGNFFSTGRKALGHADALLLCKKICDSSTSCLWREPLLSLENRDEPKKRKASCQSTSSSAKKQGQKGKS